MSASIDTQIPDLVLKRFGLVAKRTGNEYHSPCPECAGKDRCMWFADGKANGFCRQCLKTFWLDDAKQLDPLDRLEREQRARELAERERQLQAQRLATWQQRAAYRKGWNDALSYAAREWWHAQGITDETIEQYELGATRYPLVNRRTGERVNLTAYTIPIRDPESWQVVNVQYRIENPPEGVGKYRQEQGLPARSFYAHPVTSGDVLIVEGAKKAMVLDQLLEGDVQVVGLPGITPSERLIDELGTFGRKWLLPDPGVSSHQVDRFRSRLSNLQVVPLPLKPDDAVTQYGMTRTDLREWLMQFRN